jgi:hypothetical protein
MSEETTPRVFMIKKEDGDDIKNKPTLEMAAKELIEENLFSKKTKSSESKTFKQMATNESDANNPKLSQNEDFEEILVKKIDPDGLVKSPSSIALNGSSLNSSRSGSTQPMQHNSAELSKSPSQDHPHVVPHLPPPPKTNISTIKTNTTREKYNIRFGCFFSF